MKVLSHTHTWDKRRFCRDILDQKTKINAVTLLTALPITVKLLVKEEKYLHKSTVQLTIQEKNLKLAQFYARTRILFSFQFKEDQQGYLYASAIFLLTINAHQQLLKMIIKILIKNIS